MKKILILTLNPFFPLTHGGAVAQYFFLELMQHNFDITIITNFESSEDFKNAKRKLDRIKIINIEAFRLSFWDKLLLFSNKVIDKFLIRKSFRIAVTAKDMRYRKFIKLHLKKNKYDIVQFEFFNSLNLAESIKNIPSKKIFVHHELRFKRFLLENKKKDIIDVVRRFELNNLSLFDSIVVFNDDDKKLLASLNKNVNISPFGIPDDLIEKKEISKTFTRLVFIGSSVHKPNLEGLIWFINKIYLETGLKNFPLDIIGFWKEEHKALISKTGTINFLGIVETIQPFLEGSIMVVPIQSGSGIRTKILQGMANKTPIMTTRFAAEGLYSDYSNDHFIYIDDFATQSVFDMTNDDTVKLLIEKACKGYEYYQKHFNTTKLLNQRIKLYN